MSAPIAAVAADLAPSGRLRASINLGNPVLAQGAASNPLGVTVDIARELAGRLEVELDLLCFDAARESFAAIRGRAADICFLAIDPARATDVWFTEPYVLIEGVYAVTIDAPVATAADIDRVGPASG